MEGLQIGVLGPVEARRGGRALDLGGPRQRVVLARVAISPGRPVPSATLFEALWGPDPPPNATANLHTYVSRLRSVIGRDRLVRTAGGYRLDVAPGDVDIGRAERLAADAGAQGADPAAAVDLLSAALDLWRGDPLCDLPDALPFAAELARLHEWRLQLIEQRCARLLDAGRGREALPDLARLVEDEPTREELHLLLMRCLHQAGRTAEALAAARRYRRRLAEDTGLDPGTALRDLEQQLRIGDPPPASAAGPGQPPRAAPPARRQPAGDLFVGRRTDLDQIDAALSASAAFSTGCPSRWSSPRTGKASSDSVSWRNGCPRACRSSSRRTRRTGPRR
ncbi:MAG TPA: BTAD domain-containing putative transcriptional regulator [Actinomycetospora sp.]|nr:BTAD domain-containing putative transcriptional regulator [Actinomycetospora sp.]